MSFVIILKSFLSLLLLIDWFFFVNFNIILSSNNCFFANEICLFNSYLNERLFYILCVNLFDLLSKFLINSLFLSIIVIFSSFIFSSTVSFSFSGSLCSSLKNNFNLSQRGSECQNKLIHYHHYLQEHSTKQESKSY